MVERINQQADHVMELWLGGANFKKRPRGTFVRTMTCENSLKQ